MKNYKKYNSGFTLIEIMVTVAIVGIFASIALPSFSRLIESNRISTATQQFQSNLLLTRSEALKRSNTVTLCSSTDQANCNGTNDYSTGWIIFLDCDDDNVVEETIADCGPNNREEIIKVGEGFDSLFITGNGGDTTSFNFTGRPAGVTTFNIGKLSNAAQKRITVNVVGRVKAKNLP